MTSTSPLLLDAPMPIRTPRLLLRPNQPGDGPLTAAAVAETWNDLHQWMAWAETPEDHTVEKKEIRTRQVMAKFLLREEFNLLGIETATGQAVVWCGFHNMDWEARHCETGYWVRKGAQRRGFATEATGALLRYAFGPLGMRRVGITHAAGNEASRRVIEKLGFTPEGMQRQASLLPDGRIADKLLYARLNLLGLPALEVHWGSQSQAPCGELTQHLRALEEQLLNPKIRSRPEALASLLTDDFREFGSSGRTFTKTEILALLASEPPQLLSLQDFHCTLLADNAALVTYRSTLHINDSTIASALRSSVWIHQPEGWRLHFHQGTRL